MVPNHAAAIPQNCPTAPPCHPPAPTSRFVLGYPPMLLAGPGIGAASTSRATSPASPSARTTKSQFQEPTSHLCPGPAAAASGKKRPAACDRRTQGTGKTWGGGPLGGVGGALRPRTHFIPSHLYWISRISGLRELVYPIRLHCKGRLPASSLTARGHGMLCRMCMGTRLGVGGVGGAARGTISSLHHNSLPQTLAAVAGLLAPMGVPNGCPCGPILLHANNWPWWHSHRGPTWSPTVLRMEGQGPTPPPPPPTMGGALRIAY